MNPLAILEIGSKILDKVFPDPAQKAEAQAKLLQLQQAGELKELDSAMQIIVSEAKSDHFLVASWRPITMLTFVGLIVAKWLGFTADGVTPEIELMLLEIIKVGLGGYVIGRTGEKMIKTWKEK